MKVFIVTAFDGCETQVDSVHSNRQLAEESVKLSKKYCDDNNQPCYYEYYIDEFIVFEPLEDHDYNN